MLKVVFAGGGTLGSVSPLLAVREAMPSATCLFIGTRTGPESHFVSSHGMQFTWIPSIKLRRYFSVSTIIGVVKFPIALIKAVIILQRFSPDVVISCGGFVAVPVGIAAKILRIPTIIHQQDIRPGLANKILSSLATTITVSFPEQLRLFPSKKTVCLGNPARSITRSTRTQDSILILGGSQGARGMNDALRGCIPLLAERYRVVHMLGAHNIDQKMTLPKQYLAVQFLDREYAEELSRALLVISRAGMSTITECAAARKASVLVPIPNSHQVDNARFFAARNAAVTASQHEPDLLKNEIMRLLDSSDERRKLGDNLHALFPAAAARSFANLVVKTYAKAKQKKAFVIGIGGIGISSIVQYLIRSGYSVSGSDIAPNEVTARLQKQGVAVVFGHRKEHITRDFELILYSTAVPLSNEEITQANKLGLPVYSYKEYLGALSARYRTIAICGTHGKTTTTAMIGCILADTDLDPTVIVGTYVPQLANSNFRHGTSNYLVVEADEYRADMLKLTPAIEVLTNIDADHMDYYRDIDHVYDTFQSFVDKLPADGLLVKNNDDVRLAQLTASRTVSYGIRSAADYRALDRTVTDGQQRFSVTHGKKKIGEFTLQIPGAFNVLNALAAIACASELGIPLDHIRQRLASYHGSWRRFEQIGSHNQVPIYSDYGHHPTEIQSTLQAFREFFPTKKLLLVFQPHSYSRTEKLLPAFAQALTLADELILCEIYDVAGRDHDHSVSTRDIMAKLDHRRVWYASDPLEGMKLATAKLTPGHVLVIMGAGDVDATARTYLQTL